jgi:hypothetical protein
VAAPNPAPEADADRASILAEMATAARAADPAPKAKIEPAVEAPADETDPPPADEPAAEVEAPEEKPEPAKVEPKPDPEGDRRLAAIQKAEKAQKQQAAADRAALAKERLEIDAARKEAEAERAELAKFRDALKRAKYDPAGVLEALGVPAERFEDASQQIYARSEKGKTDPRYREVSERAMREREAADRLAAAEEKFAAFEKRIEAREQARAAERAAERHMSGVFKAARSTTEAPLLARAFAKNAEKAENRLAQIALELAQETGELPDAEDIITTYEKRRRQELEDEDVDVDALLKTKPKDKTAEKKTPARTLSNDLSTSTQVRRSDLSEQEEREVHLAELAKLSRAAEADASRG